MSEWVTASDIATMVYCPRKLWLIGAGNSPRREDLVRGEIAHEAVDRAKRVDVRDPVARVSGTCDVLGNGELVEYKSSRPGSTPVIRDHHLAQIATYRHCATASGSPVSDSFIWFTEQKHRTAIPSEDLDRFDVPALANKVRDVLASASSPPVLEDDPRCRHCSLIEVCQPSTELVSDPRIVVPVPDSRLVYVDSSMIRLSLSKGRIKADIRDGSPRTFPLDKVSGLVVLSDRTAITTPLIVELLRHGRSITYTRRGSIPVGYAAPLTQRNGTSRQALSTLTAKRRLYLAAEMIRAKIHNQAARAGTSDAARSAAAGIRKQRDRLKPSALDTLTESRCESTIFGAEGGAAHLYFTVFFAELPEWVVSCGSTQRIGKGAHDPVNVLLNYGYSVLHGAVTRALLACGLDPSSGVLHSPSRNKPALVLDIGEQFRVPIVDTTVRQLLNNRIITRSSFTESRGRFGMTKPCRTALITSLTDKLADKHNYLPGAYEMTWERSIEYQIRALLRYVDGTSSEWKGIYIR